MTNNKGKKKSFLSGKNYSKDYYVTDLSVPPEGAEVGHVICIQAEEQISGFGTLFFKDS